MTHIRPYVLVSSDEDGTLPKAVCECVLSFQAFKSGRQDKKERELISKAHEDKTSGL
jgi:hypothetical protein